MKRRLNSKTMNILTDFGLKTKVKPFILLDNVTLQVNGSILFQNFHWVIGSGEHWAVTGPNGSGKSILAKAICREIPFAKGRIVYYFGSAINDGGGANSSEDDNSGDFKNKANSLPHGRPFFNPGEIILISPQAHQELARRFSSYHQARWQSFEGGGAPLVKEFLSGKSIEHRSPYEVTPLRTKEEVYLERRAKAIGLLKIEHLLDRKIIHLSHGETRKVMLARALMQAPRLLILDDPFSGLDQNSRRILSKAITGLTAGHSPQILLITANIMEIAPGITHLLSVNGPGSVTKISRGFKTRFPAPQSNQLPSPAGKSANYSSTGGQSGHTECARESQLFQPILPNWPKVSQNQILIEMKNVSIVYGKVKVLRNLNWTVRQGERWAVLGPNGAGKSTLLSLILGDNPQAYSNNIALFGKTRGSGESIWDIKRQIGWISPEQQIYCYQNLTCYETVCTGFFDSLGLYQECSVEQAGIASYWMRCLGIAGLADRLFRAVSVGEQRLSLLARALVKNPLLLILDEPCQGLDPGHRQDIIQLLDLLCRQTPVSVIYVTHYLDELPQAITHVLKLDRGRMIESGPKRRSKT
ncbi:MAG: ATP-binding cassette domain-containing protein [Firmicutes bacterium]|nr:ATP-binding cassette domain-containing protein [Bacillota bacterium]